MKLIPRKNIDDAKWNSCVLNSKNGLIYGLTWFLDGLVEDWQGLVWESENRYDAVFPVPVRRKFGLKYVYPPFFIQQLGLFSQEDDFENQEQEAISFLGKKFKLMQLYLNYQSGIGQTRTNYILNLSADYSKTQKSYSSNHKRNLKKAEQANLAIRETEVSEVISLFKNDRGLDGSNYKEKDYKNFEVLVNSAIKQNQAFVKGVYYSNELICGGVFMQFKNRVVFLFSGNSVKGKDWGALFLLLDSVVRQYSKSGFILDFEGSQNEGLARFYKGFGAEDQPYKFIEVNKLPKFLKKLKS